MNRPWITVAAAVACLSLAAAFSAGCQDGEWTSEELSKINGLWIGNLPPLPPDPTNRFADDPSAAAFGHKLFFDRRLSSNGEVSCATCHVPHRSFQDGIALAKGVGRTNRRTMTVVGTAYSPWLFWDGRKDHQWGQALGPLENPVEHGGNRTMYAHVIARHYRSEYERIFGRLPALAHLPRSAGPVDDPEARAAWESMCPEDRRAVTAIYVNMGKAIAAYERLLLPGPSAFDRYVEALRSADVARANVLLSEDARRGLRLFVGKANCTQCHNGPLFTNNDFHNTGVPEAAGLPIDDGRALGAKQVLADEFNCQSVHSDAKDEDCGELKFLVADGPRLIRQFKPPTLRSVTGRGPFMHAGQFATLDEVLDHYDRAPKAPRGESELRPLGLSASERGQLKAFLGALDSPVRADERWLQDPFEDSNE